MISELSGGSRNSVYSILSIFPQTRHRTQTGKEVAAAAAAVRAVTAAAAEAAAAAAATL